MLSSAQQRVFGIRFGGSACVFVIAFQCLVQLTGYLCLYQAQHSKAPTRMLVFRTILIVEVIAYAMSDGKCCVLTQMLCLLAQLHVTGD